MPDNGPPTTVPAPFADDDPVRGRFPADYIVSKPQTDGRYQVYDPSSRCRWMLGTVELDVARQFSPGRTYRSISLSLRQGHRRAISPQQLRAFEERLLAVGVLQHLAGRAPFSMSNPNPWSGLFGRLVHLEFVSFDPGRVLDATQRRLPWLMSRYGVALLGGFTIVLLTVLGTRFGEFVREIPAALSGWGLLWLYLVYAVSLVFHEGGHALACRGYGVEVEEITIGVRSLALFAWTKPEQESWNGLDVRARVGTIVAGPLGSLGYAALGALGWLVSPPGSPVRTAGLLVVLVGTLGLVPTLLPMFRGDLYLLLTDLFGRPNLRQRAFGHLRRTLAGDRRAAEVRSTVRLGYLGFCLASAAGHLALAGFVLWLIWTFALQPRGG